MKQNRKNKFFFYFLLIVFINCNIKGMDDFDITDNPTSSVFGKLLGGFNGLTSNHPMVWNTTKFLALQGGFIFYNSIISQMSMELLSRSSSRMQLFWDILRRKSLVPKENFSNLVNEVPFLLLAPTHFRKEYEEIGAKLEKLILLYGAPGVGKTAMARAFAGEMGAYFLPYSGSDFTTQVYKNSGSLKLMQAFDRAKYLSKKGPVVFFIDEFDSVGSRDSNGSDGFKRNNDNGHDDGNDVAINRLLGETSDELFKQYPDLYIVGATNRLNKIDSTVLRPGRFTPVEIPLPHLKGRFNLLKSSVKGKNFNVAALCFLKSIAARTDGFSAADLKQIVNDAATICVHQKIKEKMDGKIFATKFINKHHLELGLEEVRRKKRLTNNDYLGSDDSEDSTEKNYDEEDGHSKKGKEREWPRAVVEDRKKRVEFSNAMSSNLQSPLSRHFSRHSRKEESKNHYNDFEVPIGLGVEGLGIFDYRSRIGKISTDIDISSLKFLKQTQWS